MPAAKTVKIKKKCCKSGPRCKRCPVVLKRLEAAGHASRTGKRTYEVGTSAKKKVVRGARAR